MTEPTRSCTVRLRTATGVERASVSASVLATDDAVIDKARRAAGVAGAALIDGTIEPANGRVATDGGALASGRVPPLNLTTAEAKYLWAMISDEVGKEAVQYSEDRPTVESLHTKIGAATPGVSLDE